MVEEGHVTCVGGEITVDLRFKPQTKSAIETKRKREKGSQREAKKNL